MMGNNPYVFREEDAIRFADFIGIKARKRGNNLDFKKCPYCSTVATSSDERTFAINLETGQFNCFRASCGAKGNMVTLHRDFGFSLGTSADEYFTPKKEYKRFKTPKTPIVPKSSALEYLKSRGISEEIAKRYEITVQTDRDNVLVFPFFDDKGSLEFVKYRKTDFDKEKDKAKEWCQAGGKPILFGMKQAKRANKLVITEGQMDSLSVAEATQDVDAVSVPTGAKGFTWIPYCWNFVSRYEQIIVFGDYEKGGMTLLDELHRRFGDKVSYVNPENYLGCKDANEILLRHGADAVRKCVAECVSFPVRSIIEVSDVEDVDIAALPKLKTGIKCLDSFMYGGLPFGGYTLVTGKPGEGKSTLASQILINSIEQGYNVLAYSGELPNYMFKEWATLQIAGGNHTFAYQNQFGDFAGYSVMKDNKALISEWYRGKFFLYDNSSIDGDESTKLCSVIEEAIHRYNIKVVLIDNLMTAIDVNSQAGTDQYERQSQFCREVAKLGLKNDVCILLVAHKRKNTMSANENDEVAGSGDVGRLAMVTLTYERDKNIDENNRKLKVSKNRLFGKTNPDGWEVKFDERSKRVYYDDDEKNHEYNWVTDDGISEGIELKPYWLNLEPGEEVVFD